MRDEYDFSKGEKNPYVKAEKQVVTMRLDAEIVRYFKELAVEFKLPYQTLMNSCLADCVRQQRKPWTTWK